MSNISKLTPAEQKFFNDTMANIKSTKQIEKHNNIFNKLKWSIHDKPVYQDLVKANDYVINIKKPIPHKILTKFKTGKLDINMQLDLHGYNCEQSRQELDYFIQECQRQDIRNALIIHGKGLSSNTEYPILKNYSIHWLSQCPVILAFCSAIQQNGGTGALYILLKANSL